MLGSIDRIQTTKQLNRLAVCPYEAMCREKLHLKNLEGCFDNWYIQVNVFLERMSVDRLTHWNSHSASSG